MSDSRKKVCIVTFGCQMNKLDSQLLRGELDRVGYGLTEEPDDADVILYNTCSVRDQAENRVLSHLGALRQRAERQEGFILGVIGCMAQRMGREIIHRFGHVNLVCGTRAFLRVPGHLARIAEGEGPIVDLEGEQQPAFDRPVDMRTSAHQAYVSVMRGCDNFCAYCIVPHVRGREASRSPLAVLDEVRRLADGGVREVTLLGQNVNSYSADGRGLADLLEMINQVNGLLRIRFVTSHPRDMSDDILRAVAGLDKVCEHLHVPPQAGSDAVLERMRRGYTRAEYMDMAERARALVPDVELAGDFIVGFPGETEADFRQSVDLLREVRFQQSYIFRYSPRPGTLAARMQDDVPEQAKRSRHQRLLAAQEQVDASRRQGMVGESVEVLVEGVSKGDPDNLTGRTRQNDIVCFPGDESLAGSLQTVRVTEATTLTLLGEVTASPPAAA